jgi:diphosphomevalonate decarboxylase
MSSNLTRAFHHLIPIAYQKLIFMLTYINPDLLLELDHSESGKIAWRSPSNIAIIKYWGKHGNQLPRNPSLSMTLESAYTEMLLEYAPKTEPSAGISLDFRFEGVENEKFKAKITRFLENQVPIFPFLEQLDLKIYSGNSFPHSAGIASSASSSSALALCLCTLEDRLFGTLQEDADFHQKTSYVARLGSGSACRSIYEHFSVWGETPDVAGSSDEYAIGYADVHEVFKTYHDDILIVSKAEKSVSSRAGHGLMEGNPFAAARYAQARENLHNLLPILQTGDVHGFGEIAEAEALELHALMRKSTPSFDLMLPNTHKIIEKIYQYRAQTKQPVYFTLDAGPNIHLLYPHEFQDDVQGFVITELAKYCEDGDWMADNAGEGPVELTIVDK